MLSHIGGSGPQSTLRFKLVPEPSAGYILTRRALLMICPASTLSVSPSALSCAVWLLLASLQLLAVFAAMLSVPVSLLSDYEQQHPSVYIAAAAYLYIVLVAIMNVWVITASAHPCTATLCASECVILSSTTIAAAYLCLLAACSHPCH